MPRPTPSTSCTSRSLIGLLFAGMLAVSAAAFSPASAEIGPDVTPLHESVDHGDLLAIDLNQPIVAMAPSPTGAGYWLVASDGGVFTFGDVAFHGSTGAIDLVSPVVGMWPLSDGSGYWLVAGDGGVFTFGDAVFHGSAGAIDLAQPVVGMAATTDGSGYWLVAADGGVFTYGTAGFFGSTGALELDEPIVAMAATPSGSGYWLVGRDGGVFAFGDASFHGSAVDPDRQQDALSIGVSSAGGYWILTGDGRIHSFGPVDHDPSPTAMCGTSRILGGAVAATGVWVYSTEISIPQPPFSSNATTIDGNSIAEQLSYIQACQTVGEPEAADFINPFPGSIVSSRYGFRLHPLWDIVILHAGTDLVIPEGTLGLPVLAASDGVVVAVDDRSAYGSTILIDHGDRVATVYAHLSTVDVSVGDVVEQGDTVGGAGSTGFVTGPHLHVEVRVNGEPRNPEALMSL